MTKVYYDSDLNVCVIGSKEYSSDGFTRDINELTGSIVLTRYSEKVLTENINNVCDANGNPYPDYDTFRTAIKNFFVNASEQAYSIELAEANFSYGILVDNLFSDPTCTRIGNLSLHQSLPVTSAMKGCLLDDNGAVNYYLNPSDWTKKADGTASKRDGTDGQVKVELPKNYMLFRPLGGTKFEVRVSMIPIQGFSQVEKRYVSAYEASLQRSTGKLCSVMNATADYRGGDNNAAYDATSKSLLQKPVSSLSLAQLRNAARLRGSVRWNCNTYDVQKQLFWLFAIEYATLNSQLPVIGRNNVTGYMTGGLGNGITTANDTEWLNFNGRNPFCNCGTTDSLGNGSGEVSFTVTDFGGAGVNRSFTANRYRGIENPFGHLWKWTDGVLVDVKTDAAGATSKLYTSSDASKFSSVAFTDYDYKGLIARDEGFIKTIMFGASGDIMPTSVGGSSATYFTDYFNRDITASVIKGVLFGGAAANGSNAGLGYSNANSSPSGAASTVGSRLCFI